jgi:hypothetical protein
MENRTRLLRKYVINSLQIICKYKTAGENITAVALRA